MIHIVYDILYDIQFIFLYLVVFNYTAHERVTSEKKNKKVIFQKCIFCVQH